MQALITKGSPLIFAFHGTGGDEHQFAGLTAQLWPGAGLVSPRGTVSEYGANRFFRRKAEGVYDMDDLALRTEEMIAFVRDHQVPGVPSYAFGYSNGANILASVSFRAPDLFDRLALLHPLIPFAPPAQPGLAGRQVLITGGRRDPIAPLAATEALSAYYRAQGAEVSTLLHDGGHALLSEELMALQHAFAP